MATDPPRRSLLNRVARRLSGLGDKVRQGVDAVRDEARHPGKPQPHREGRDPVWRTAADREADRAAPSTPYAPGGDPGVDPFAPPVHDGTAGGEAWYLNGEDPDEGWRETDPVPEPPAKPED